MADSAVSARMNADEPGGKKIQTKGIARTQQCINLYVHTAVQSLQATETRTENIAHMNVTYMTDSDK